MIRQLNDDYLDEVMLLINEVIIEMNHNGIDQWDAFYPNRAIIEQDIYEKCAYGYFDEAEVAGYLAINEVYAPEYDELNWKHDKGEFLVVHRLAIRPDKQKKGIAKTLMNFVAFYAKQNGYKSIRLDAFPGNPGALRLYQSLAYHKTGSVQFRKGLFFCYEKELL